MGSYCCCKQQQQQFISEQRQKKKKRVRFQPFYLTNRMHNSLLLITLLRLQENELKRNKKNSKSRKRCKPPAAATR